MNERYLFRGKSRDGGEWRTGSLSLIGHKMYIDTTPTDGGRYSDRADPATVGQCTGLCDKNGVFIFEGDILEDEKTNDRYYIAWDWDYARFYLRYIGDDTSDDISVWVTEDPVIGNIHDNPEMLKEVTACPINR